MSAVNDGVRERAQNGNVILDGFLPRVWKTLGMGVS